MSAEPSLAVLGGMFRAILTERPSDVVVESMMDDVVDFLRGDLEGAIAVVRARNTSVKDKEDARQFLDGVVGMWKKHLAQATDEQLAIHLRDGRIRGPR